MVLPPLDNVRRNEIGVPPGPVPWAAIASRMARLGCALTVAKVIAVLFVGFGSYSLCVTVARFVTDPTVSGVKLRVTVAVAPLIMEPKAQVTMPLVNEQMPCVEVADRKLAAAGIG